MLGGKNKQPLGYTIVEVLIVLAVSGMMFVIAMNFINGKQAKAAFAQGTNELASQVQNTIEQVTNGQFSDIPLNCTFNGTVTDPNQPGMRPPGTNSTCVFLGKILRFQSGTTSYDTLSLAAGRVTTDAAGAPVTPTLTNVAPAVVTSLTRTQAIPQRLEVSSVRTTNADGTSGGNVYNFGFVQGLGTVEGSSFLSGAQTIAMFYSTPAGAPINSGTLRYAKAASICMTDGTRFAQVLVGAQADSASQLSVRVKNVKTAAQCQS